MSPLPAIETRRDPKAISSASLRAFFGIANAWNITSREQSVLLSCAESTLFKWKKNPNTVLDRDKLERISYILGIYKALQILFPEPDQADSWIKKPNNAPLFNGKSALDRMLGGSLIDLADVRRYLDAERGGW